MLGLEFAALVMAVTLQGVVCMDARAWGGAIAAMLAITTIGLIVP